MFLEGQSAFVAGVVLDEELEKAVSEVGEVLCLGSVQVLVQKVETLEVLPALLRHLSYLLLLSEHPVDLLQGRQTTGRLGQREH